MAAVLVSCGAAQFLLTHGSPCKKKVMYLNSVLDGAGDVCCVKRKTSDHVGFVLQQKFHELIITHPGGDQQCIHRVQVRKCTSYGRVNMQTSFRVLYIED